VVAVTETQQLGYSGKGIKVGVIDTGIDYNHGDLHVSGRTSNQLITESNK